MEKSEQCDRCGSLHIYTNVKEAVLSRSKFVVIQPICLDCGKNLEETYQQRPLIVGTRTYLAHKTETDLDALADQVFDERFGHA